MDSDQLVTVEPEESVTDPVPETPVPLMTGTFVIYSDDDGGYVLVAEITQDGETKVKKQHVNKRMIKLVGPLIGKLGLING